MSWGAALGFKIAFAFDGFNFFLHSGTPPLPFLVFVLRRHLLSLNGLSSILLVLPPPIISFVPIYCPQRVRNGCRGRIADMTVPEALRVDTDGGIKPDMAFLALLCEV